MAGKGISKRLDNFVEKTVWIWLPFVAFFLLIKKIMKNKKK
jgi:hypothetical protein